MRIPTFDPRGVADRVARLRLRSGWLLFAAQERKFVQFEDGESRGARTFKRPEVLQVIEDNFGAGMASFIDEACTNVGQPRQTIYVSTKPSEP